MFKISLTLLFMTICSDVFSGQITNSPHQLEGNEDSVKGLFLDLEYKRSIDPRSYVLNQVESRVVIYGFCASVRYSHHVLSGLLETRRLRSADIQFIGISTRPDARWSGHLTLGTYINFEDHFKVGQLSGRITRKERNGLRIWAEGRSTLAARPLGRVEASLSASYPIVQNSKHSFSILGYTSSSSYRMAARDVPVDILGFGGLLSF